MKLISLNTWSGKLFDPLMAYLEKESADTDIFCFQEIFDTPTGPKVLDSGHRGNLYQELTDLLVGHRGYFAPSLDNNCFDGAVDYPLQWGLAMFVREGLSVDTMGDVFVYGKHESGIVPKVEIGRNLQYLVLNEAGEKYTIMNLHGLWNGQGKSDTPNRIEQSRKTRNFMDQAQGKRILCGDFNLLPETKSFEILKEGYVDLIDAYGITDTRGVYYKKPLRFADYVLVDPTVCVDSFEVPHVGVSDHLPMVLEFS